MWGAPLIRKWLCASLCMRRSLRMASVCLRRGVRRAHTGAFVVSRRSLLYDMSAAGSTTTDQGAAHLAQVGLSSPISKANAYISKAQRATLVRLLQGLKSLLANLSAANIDAAIDRVNNQNEAIALMLVQQSVAQVTHDLSEFDAMVDGI
jgi:hypothetical protein